VEELGGRTLATLARKIAAPRGCAVGHKRRDRGRYLLGSCAGMGRHRAGQHAAAAVRRHAAASEVFVKGDGVVV
jgi:hypothetical protein